MNVQRGDIVLVDFPYSDQTGHKVRPALVVQSDVWNPRLDDTIIALITSSRHRRIGLPHSIPLTFRQLKAKKPGYDSIPLFNAKICTDLFQ